MQVVAVISAAQTPVTLLYARDVKNQTAVEGGKTPSPMSEF